MPPKSRPNRLLRRVVLTLTSAVESAKSSRHGHCRYDKTEDVSAMKASIILAFLVLPLCQGCSSEPDAEQTQCPGCSDGGLVDAPDGSASDAPVGEADGSDGATGSDAAADANSDGGSILPVKASPPNVFNYLTEKLTPAKPTSHQLHAGDFNGDGMTDVLAHHTTNGGVVMTLLRGESPLKIGTLQLSKANLVGTGDFNGDGKSDLLLRDGTELSIKFLNGTSGLQTSKVTTLGSQWSLGAIDDFNGDGRDDVLWRNPKTGESHLHLINGAKLLASGGALPKVALKVDQQQSQEGAGMHARTAEAVAPTRILSLVTRTARTLARSCQV